MKIIFTFLLIILFPSDSFSQHFVKITDTANPLSQMYSQEVISDPAGWMLIMTESSICLQTGKRFQNLGGGNFTQTGTGLQNQTGNLAIPGLITITTALLTAG
ncbi:MAG: hypothetical protein IPL53_09545 [Ignavibacteria bacterium]|nr:hypothetical protein [Ignavibacteria bacterium]